MQHRKHLRLCIALHYYYVSGSRLRRPDGYPAASIFYNNIRFIHMENQCFQYPFVPFKQKKITYSAVISYKLFGFLHAL